ncbi:MAG: hypothetical protein ABI743_13295, partial [bacterium]
ALLQKTARQTANNLMLMDAGGNNPTRLTYSASGDYWPVVLQDGRISFRRWDNLRANPESEYCPTVNIPFGFPENFWMADINGVSIWVINPDGTIPDLYYGSHLNRDRRVFMDHSELPDGKLLAVAAPMNSTYGAGTIAILNTAEYDDVEIPDYITEPEAAADALTIYGRYRFPARLSDGRYVAIYAPGGVFDDDETHHPQFGLVVVDSQGNRRSLVDDVDSWEWSPIELKARPMPATIAPSDNAQNWATLGCANIFLRDAREPESKDPQPIPLPEVGYKIRMFTAMLTNDTGLHEPWDNTDIVRPHNFIGEIPVKSDGSWAAMLPAHTPLTWQVVDPQGKVRVIERFFTHMEGGETRFCQGCHAPQRPGAFAEVDFEDTLAYASPTDLRPN